VSLDIDPARSRAVLLGVSFFPRDPDRLPALPAVRNNLRDLARLLADPKVIGLDSRHIVVVDDRPSTEMLSRLAEVAADAEDAIIVYYAGHGLIGGTQLYLTGTDSSDRMIEFDGMPIDRLRRALMASPARKRVLILDCCYSGRAAELMGTTRAMLQASIDDIQGAYVLASSGATEASVAPDGARHTAFTGELLRILEEGIESAGPTLKLPEIYRELFVTLRRNPKLPEPQHSASKTVGEMAFVRNRAFLAAASQAVPERADEPALARAEEPEPWRQELIERIEQQARMIETLQQQVAERSPAQAEKLAHTEAAEGLAEDQTAYRHGGTGDSDAKIKAYAELLDSQQERIAELERALAEPQRPPPLSSPHSDGAAEPSFWEDFRLRFPRLALALSGTQKPRVPPPESVPVQPSPALVPGPTSTRRLGVGTQAIILVAALVSQAMFIAVLEIYYRNRGIAIMVWGGATLLCGAWLWQRYHKNHFWFCLAALLFLPGFWVVVFFSRGFGLF
jgi:uncharacterized caspase-like protein